MKAHIKEHPVWFSRFDALWTPTVIILDANGKERWRNEGYLPRNEFVANLRNGLGRVAFMQKKWSDAEKWYEEVVHFYPETVAAPEAMYWRATAYYKRTNDHTALNKVARQLQDNYAKSLWDLKAIPWRGASS